ncbi:SGNH/GDSL hydrolase family protein [Leptospira inadai serovar Lyme]|uniref:SGNH/GDSL hydrolase family protein n=2 Tax=Leptospira inadai serovar Lyme TaxID=293084 RepID=A0ABX4YDY4_9LEPT|nr:SGNH/GDSL hydrolase family protein [Leptospira inadai serovar Lyme]
MEPRQSIRSPFLFLLIFIGSFACQNIGFQNNLINSNSKSAISTMDPVHSLLLADLILDQMELTPDECMSTYGAMNLSWPLPDYYGRISSDTRDYANIIGIDSTMDISRQYGGFLNTSQSLSVAVIGNTACDEITQLDAIKTQNPRNFIISTADANGLLHGINNDYVVFTVKRLISKIRGRWPTIRIAVVGIHPTRNAAINNNKDYTNSQVGAYMQTLSNSCYYDPLPLFGVGPGESAPTSLMLDTVHYTEAISFQIKSKLQTVCGISI